MMEIWHFCSFHPAVLIQMNGNVSNDNAIINILWQTSLQMDKDFTVQELYWHTWLFYQLHFRMFIHSWVTLTLRVSQWARKQNIYLFFTDLVLVDEDLNIKATYISGEEVWRKWPWVFGGLVGDTHCDKALSSQRSQGELSPPQHNTHKETGEWSPVCLSVCDSPSASSPAGGINDFYRCCWAETSYLHI